MTRAACTCVPAVFASLLIAAAPAPAGTSAVESTLRPIARIAGNIICCPGERVLIDGWASIAVGGEITAWLWDYNSNGVTDTITTTGELEVAAPRSSKVYAISLRVRDNRGAVSQPDTAIVNVMDVGPRVRMRADTTVKVGVRVRFEPQVTWVCAPPVRFEWDFYGSGRPEYQSERDGNTSKVYYTPGRYQAQLYVVDAAGRKAGCITTVNVTDRHGALVSSTVDTTEHKPEL